ncbi:MAG: hypothetical protein Q9M28_12175 [Mariprofundaceae bacterium]|nr:hypothetical protein [Mariprofundaceae bacterium]
MSNAKEMVELLMKVEGAVAAMLVDSSCGLVLAEKTSGDFDVDVAAAGNTKVVQAKRETMKRLGLESEIEDILITLCDQIHLITPWRKNPEVFGYLVIAQGGATLGMARKQLKDGLAVLSSL